MIEKIDRPEGKEDPTQALINNIIEYLESDRSITNRLALERRLRKYQESNNPEWILNFTCRIWQTLKEKK